MLWDFDGTLAHRPGWSDTLVAALDEVLPGHGVAVDAVRPGLRDGFPWHAPSVGHSFATADAWWDALAPLLVGACTAAGACGDLSGLVAAFRAAYLDPSCWTVYDDVAPALDALSGWRHVIVSNHVPELPALVRALGLPVDAVVTSAAVGWEKPNPRIFSAALSAAGSPEEAWMVGDNVVADVRGAEAVGLPAVLVRRFSADVERYAPGLAEAVAFIGR